MRSPEKRSTIVSRSAAMRSYRLRLSRSFAIVCLFTAWITTTRCVATSMPRASGFDWYAQGVKLADADERPPDRWLCSRCAGTRDPKFDGQILGQALAGG